MAKKNKRNDSYLSIRKKLIAAVAMLLVASFMVASSSYAWFTLSTAPEVTGIQTTVGANGSLEIALLDEDGADPDASTTSDGASDDVKEKNITWGNLVDLSDEAYGLNTVVLKPARLNADATSGTVGTSLLLVPVYGADGRISEMNDTTVSGVYKTGSKAFGTSGKGVRGVGTTTTMTLQQLAFDSAKSQVITNLNAARKGAVDSLQNNGPILAFVLTSYASNATEYDLTCVGTMLADIATANDKIEAAIRAYYDALVAIELDGETDSVYNSAVATLDLANKNLEDIISGTGITIPAGFDVAWPVFGGTDDTSNIGTTIKLWKANKTAISSAKAAYEAENDVTKLEWAKVTSILTPLINVDAATLNGKTVTEVKADPGSIMNSVIHQGIVIEFGPTSGVYANIASVTKDYQANIKFLDGTTVSVGTTSVDLTDGEANMKVTGVDPNKNISANNGNTEVWSHQFQPKETDSEAVIADAYAYAIDLAFRTNASGSSLQLQTDAVGRIYGTDDTTDATMGHGATMSFSAVDSGLFTVDQVKRLMSAVRIVFTTVTDAGEEIIAVGVLDIANVTAAGTELTAGIKLVEYSLEAVPNAGAKINVVTENDAPKFKTSPALMELNQNDVHKLSVLVFLDGDKVTNADVATGDNSVTGTLNLQFSSDADLKPMEYADLMKAGEAGEDENASTITGVPATAATGATVTLPEKDSNDVTIVWSVAAGDTTGSSVTGNTLTVGGTAGTLTLNAKDEAGAALGAGTYTITVSEPTP